MVDWTVTQHTRRAVWRVAQDFGRDTDGAAWARRVASQSDGQIMSDLRALAGEAIGDEAWNALVARVRTEAREQLVAERGNPAPYRLA